MWIASWTTVVTSLITLIGTLATLHSAPDDLVRKVVPNAEVTQTVTQTAVHTVTARATVTVTTTPGLSEPPTDTPTSGVTDSTVYLADLSDQITDYRGNHDSGSYAINGHDYPHSVALSSYGVGTTSWAEYTLNGSYSFFRARLGLNDVMSTDSVSEFAVYGNGRLLKRVRVSYAGQMALEVPVKGLVKLRIAATRTAGGDGGALRGAVFGDALLSP
ncbi:NPCBM/NEW2 domain-containing protein [Microbispora sp. ZYX-F-249]|uniref:NPCBM/NEW2 domain-containing protein n=1 Tax=Microbispora maris TaxID=3144104 RepID=A0ABV0B1W8_9ACTN